MSIKPHMSASQYKRWMECPATEYAMQTGVYERPVTPALHGGIYVDLALLSSDDAAQAYAEQNGMLTKSGQLNKTSYGWCDTAIERVRSNDEAMALLSGKTHEKIETEIGGVKWIGEIDCVCDLVPEYFVDLKTCKDFLPVWAEVDGHRRPLPFYEKWGYWLQMAVYWLALDMDRMPVVLAVTKHSTRPGLSAIYFSDTERLAREIAVAAEQMPIIEEWKSGSVVAPSCGRDDCEFCRGNGMKIEKAESLL